MLLLAIFIGILPFSLLLEKSITAAFPGGLYGEIWAFTLLHTLILPFIKFRSVRDILWITLTYFHGLAHIAHPAFRGLEYNSNYTPLYDYVVHAAQCLCIYMYHKKLFPIGVFFQSLMLTAGSIAHVYPYFLQTFVWILFSFGGIFGTIFHMNLLNKKKDNYMLLVNIILWTSPYLGYLMASDVAEWDSLMNDIGLFRVWFFNYFFAHLLYYMAKAKKN